MTGAELWEVSRTLDISRGNVGDKARTKDTEVGGKILEEFTAGNLNYSK